MDSNNQLKMSERGQTESVSVCSFCWQIPIKSATGVKFYSFQPGRSLSTPSPLHPSPIPVTTSISNPINHCLLNAPLFGPTFVYE